MPGMSCFLQDGFPGFLKLVDTGSRSITFVVCRIYRFPGFQDNGFAVFRKSVSMETLDLTLHRHRNAQTRLEVPVFPDIRASGFLDPKVREMAPYAAP